MKREVKVGVFAVAVLLAAWFGARFLKGSELFSNNYKYYAYYDQVGGIQTASHVMMYGVKVGSVTKITLDEDPSKGVELELSVDRRYRIPVDSKAKIFSNGVMGGKAVDIVMGSSPEYVEDGGTLSSEVGVDIIDMAGSELEFFKEKITEVVGSLTTTLDGINRLLDDNTRSLSSIVSNVDGITSSTDEILREQKVHLKEAIASLNLFAQSLGDNAEHIDTIMNNLNTFSTQLVEADLVGEVEQTVEHLNAVLAAADNEAGTVGKLLNDAELYDNLFGCERQSVGTAGRPEGQSEAVCPLLGLRVESRACGRACGQEGGQACGEGCPRRRDCGVGGCGGREAVVYIR